jgi:hypothetical protein
LQKPPSPPKSDSALREGPPKKSTGTPAHLLNPRLTHPPPYFFLFFLTLSVRFWALLGKGSSKTPLKKLQKVHVESFFRNFDQIFDISSPLESFLF